MYTFEQLKEDVRKEAEALRVHATKEERERITIFDLDPMDPYACIYGLASMGCYTERAAELISKCAVRYFQRNVLPDFYEGDKINMERISQNISTDVVDDFIKERTDDYSLVRYSAIEAYILLPEARNANLIAYLREEIDTLTL